MNKKQPFPVKGYILIALAFIMVGIPVFSTCTAPMRSVSGVVDLTLDADNVIRTYEWYHDAWGQLQAKYDDVRMKADFYESETDADEIRRLRIELAAVVQSCRDLSGQYNANAAKVNRNIFQRGDVPEVVDMARCEPPTH